MIQNGKEIAVKSADTESTNKTNWRAEIASKRATSVSGHYALYRRDGVLRYPEYPTVRVARGQYRKKKNLEPKGGEKKQ